MYYLVKEFDLINGCWFPDVIFKTETNECGGEDIYVWEKSYSDYEYKFKPIYPYKDPAKKLKDMKVYPFENILCETEDINDIFMLLELSK